MNYCELIRIEKINSIVKRVDEGKSFDGIFDMSNHLSKNILHFLGKIL